MKPPTKPTPRTPRKPRPLTADEQRRHAIEDIRSRATWQPPYASELAELRRLEAAEREAIEAERAAKQRSK